MENSAKALYIAGSLLIALAVISMLVAAFNNMGAVQQTKDDIQSQEAIIAFNREYEAFNKRIMYGVDVISCINKAMSNNEKYVDGGKYAEAGVSGEEALVQVEVQMTGNTLKESVEVYYFADGKERKYVGTDSIPQGQNEIGKKIWSEIIELDKPKKMPKFTGIEDNMQLINILKSDMTYGIEGQMQLLTEDSRGRIKNKFEDDNKVSLYTLISNINELDIIIQNPDENDYENWSYIKWVTCLSDFKKRKFGCESIEYNENNGYINKIVFAEKK